MKTILICGVFIAVLAVIIVSHHRNKVRPGQVWEYKCPDPFQQELSSTYTVIAVKDGYVLYKSSLTGENYSEPISWFKLGQTLRSNPTKKRKD